METLASTIERHLQAVLKPEDVDIVTTPGGDALDVSTDAWTLHVEGLPDGFAWFAVDTEPDDPASYPAARREAMPPKVESALAAADAELSGRLSYLLRASGDPFSQDLADALHPAG